MGSMAVLRYTAEAPLAALTHVYKHKLAASLNGGSAASPAASSVQSGLDMAAVAALFADASREIIDVKASIAQLADCLDDSGLSWT